MKTKSHHHQYAPRPFQCTCMCMGNAGNYINMTPFVTRLCLLNMVSWPSFQAWDRRFASSLYSCLCSTVKLNHHLFEQLPLAECLFPFYSLYYK